MMNNFIRIVMKPTVKGSGGSFNTFASFKLDCISTPFNNVSVKVGTGCSISTVPLAKFTLLESMLNTLKNNDILNGIDYMASYGVETGGRKHVLSKTYNDKMIYSA